MGPCRGSRWDARSTACRKRSCRDRSADSSGPAFGSVEGMASWWIKAGALSRSPRLLHEPGVLVFDVAPLRQQNPVTPHAPTPQPHAGQIFVEPAVPLVNLWSSTLPHLDAARREASTDPGLAQNI